MPTDKYPEHKALNPFFDVVMQGLTGISACPKTSLDEELQTFESTRVKISSTAARKQIFEKDFRAASAEWLESRKLHLTPRTYLREDDCSLLNSVPAQKGIALQSTPMPEIGIDFRTNHFPQRPARAMCALVFKRLNAVRFSDAARFDHVPQPLRQTQHWPCATNALFRYVILTDLGFSGVK